MEQVLTIGIPTYDRAPLLDRQLAWFARAVAGREHLVELIVSDNCSTDETPEVTARWQADLAAQGVRARFVRNDENVGAIRNIVGCIDAAEGAYVWVVGDDDRIDPAALRYVLDTIHEHPDLALLVLNFSSRHVKTGFRRYERCFEIDADLVEATGAAIVERLLAAPHPSRWGGLVLTTALVYRTADVQAAVHAWPEGIDNITLQLYLTASNAMRGTTIVTKEAHLEMSTGSHFFEEDPMVFFRFRIAEVPEAFVKLVELGYSRELCQEKIRNQRRELRWRRVVHLVRRRPWETVDVLLRHLRASRAVQNVGRRSPLVGRHGPTALAASGPRARQALRLATDVVPTDPRPRTSARPPRPPRA
jgi:abequosyltransferase